MATAPDPAGSDNGSGFPTRPPIAGTRRDTPPEPHRGFGDLLQKTDQFEIGWGRSDFRRRQEAIPPTSPQLAAPARAPVTHFESILFQTGSQELINYTTPWDAAISLRSI